MALTIKDKSQNFKVKPKKNLLIVSAVAVGVLVFVGVVFFTLSQLLATEKYYILNQDVPAKTQITTQMLTEVQTAKGTAPKNAITAAQVATGNTFSKVALQAGDVLVPSNTGIDIDNTVGIPDGWAVTSISIPRTQAVNGIITRGQYFDILGVNQETGETKYIATSVLALDVDSGSVDTKVDNNKSAGNGTGDTLNITVGMPSEAVANLHSALAKYAKVELALAPKSVNYQKRDTSNLQGTFNYDTDSETPDLKKGTDNTFTPVQRDSKGRPVDKK